MENETLNKIKEYAMKVLKEESGYCGVAEMPNKAFINSELKNGKDVKISIEIVED